MIVSKKRSIFGVATWALQDVVVEDLYQMPKLDFSVWFKQDAKSDCDIFCQMDEEMINWTYNNWFWPNLPLNR